MEIEIVELMVRRVSLFSVTTFFYDIAQM